LVPGERLGEWVAREKPVTPTVSTPIEKGSAEQNVPEWLRHAREGEEKVPEPDVVSLARKVLVEGVKMGQMLAIKDRWLALGHTPEDEERLTKILNVTALYNRMAQDILKDDERQKEASTKGPSEVVLEKSPVVGLINEEKQEEAKPVVSEESDFDKWVEERRLGLEKGEAPIVPPIPKDSILRQIKSGPYIPKSPRRVVDFPPNVQASLARAYRG